MSNFIEEFKKGQSGKNKGLPLGPGLEPISRAINGIQRRMMYTIASSPKVGKSTLVNYGFLISPYLYALENPDINITWIYYSWEMDRVSMEFDFCAHFLYSDFGMATYTLPEGITVDKETIIFISSAFLMGHIQDDNGEIVKVPEFILDKIKIIYENRIIPLMGEYAVDGSLLKKGKIMFIEKAENPTGIYKELLHFAKFRGNFIYQKYMKGDKEEEKLVSYIPNNPNEYVIVILDTIRKVSKERGFTMKETIDKTIEYETVLRKLLGYTFVNIVHLNRDMADIDRLKFMGDLIYPQPELIKDSGNLSEESTHVFTMFNPNDERYNLTSHFGLKIKDTRRNELFPNLRTIHLVESRFVPYPQHFRVNMNGALKDFKTFKQ